MPGGRLTQQERRRIALGLADGLAYAEIARRLDRPASTVTREVMRNGGPTAYRADLAHRATERRARRRRQGTPQRTQARPPVPGREREEAVREYEETFTGVLVATGLPAMMARVMAGLTLAETGSLTAAELARHLQVSPASVSKAVAFLDSHGLIGRERGERRHERYTVDDEVWFRTITATARSTAQLVETARQGVGVLGAHSRAAARLEDIARVLDFVTESLNRTAMEAREILRTHAGTTSDDTT
ncbi:helix-turn-helix domain-containing protein [Streptomyces sp. NPDC055721]|uniref:helix-turn-helix domain-containing protein n=1 Tax=Streptomyces sp. NPDC127132 TaxID=3345374 RepID=UPI00363D84EA